MTFILTVPTSASGLDLGCLQPRPLRVTQVSTLPLLSFGDFRRAGLPLSSSILALFPGSSRHLIPLDDCSYTNKRLLSALTREPRAMSHRAWPPQNAVPGSLTDREVHRTKSPSWRPSAPGRTGHVSLGGETPASPMVWAQPLHLSTGGPVTAPAGPLFGRLTLQHRTPVVRL